MRSTKISGPLIWESVRYSVVNRRGRGIVLSISGNSQICETELHAIHDGADFLFGGVHLEFFHACNIGNDWQGRHAFQWDLCLQRGLRVMIKIHDRLEHPVSLVDRTVEIPIAIRRLLEGMFEPHKGGGKDSSV